MRNAEGFRRDVAILADCYAATNERVRALGLILSGNPDVPHTGIEGQLLRVAADYRVHVDTVRRAYAEAIRG